MAEPNPPAITSIAIQLRFMVLFSFSEGPFLGGSYALEDALAWPNLTS
jgi:hypothetical protein